MDEHRLKAQLLGKLKPRQVTGTFQPRRADLLGPLEGPDSVMPVFCQGCGLVFELTDKGKETLQTESSLATANGPTGYYLHVTRCAYCDTEYRNPEVRPIPE